jgi:hypothetical protein
MDGFRKKWMSFDDRFDRCFRFLTGQLNLSDV